jgi:hypothetical protein
MKTKANKPTQVAKPVPVTALNSSARSKIVVAMRGAVEGIGKSGALIAQVCNAALSVSGGAKLSDGDTDAIMHEVGRTAAIRDMSVNTRKSVLSRWRTVLGVYTLIPEAEKKLRDRQGRAAWHDVMLLATRLKSNGGDIGKAVASVSAWMDQKKKPGAGIPKTKAEAITAARGAVKRILKLPRLDRDFLRKLNALCVEFEILSAK